MLGWYLTGLKLECYQLTICYLIAWERMKKLVPTCTYLDGLIWSKQGKVEMNVNNSLYFVLKCTLPDELSRYGKFK